MTARAPDAVLPPPRSARRRTALARRVRRRVHAAITALARQRAAGRRARIAAAGVSCALALALAPGAAAAAASVAPRLLVVSGIGGGEPWSQQFRDWSLAMLDAAHGPQGLPRDRLTWLCEAPERDPGRCAGRSTRDGVLAALQALPAGEPLMLLLIGHGTARDGRALFNLPGPDLSADDLSAALERFGDTPLAVVNTTAASAPFAAALSRPGRVVITATARSAEDDHTRFAGHFVAAWAGGAADADKDGRVSLLEAFRFAARRVGEEYRAKQQVATEHALLEDDGDGRGSREPGPDAPDGAVAARFHLALASGGVALTPREEALERQARAVLDQIALLRARRAALPEAEYRRVLEALLVGLAHNRRAFREGLE